MSRRFRLVRMLVGAALLLAAAPASAQWRTPSNCSATSQNLFVRDVMDDIYYWYQELPHPNPAGFASPDAFLEAIRYKTLDSHFSYVGVRATEEAFYSDSQYIGFGFASQWDGVQLRVAQVFPDSPASEAALLRGDVFLEVDGRTIESMAADGTLGSAFGPSLEGYQSEVLYRRANGEEVRATLAKRIITIPTVTGTQVYQLEDGRKVGYVFFRNFVEPSVDALNEAFATLKTAEINELVLDLRYNGGGLVSVAQHLGSLLAGPLREGQLFAEYYHNDRNQFRNRELRFETKEQALSLERLIVITTRGTASASELVINGLRPFIPVVTVGDTSYGKPVGMYGITFCDRILYPVAFSMRNAAAEGDYFEGFPATCPAADDLARQLGDPEEGSLAEALRFVRTGECTPVPVETARALARRRALPRPTGFQSIINAY